MGYAPKGTAVKMVGGPKDGRTYRYPAPLPRQLVFPRGDLYPTETDVYYRKPDSQVYIHADEIPDYKVRQSLGMED